MFACTMKVFTCFSFFSPDGEERIRIDAMKAMNIVNIACSKYVSTSNDHINAVSHLFQVINAGSQNLKLTAQRRMGIQINPVKKATVIQTCRIK